MNAIAFIHTGLANSNMLSRSTYNQQENKILEYCLNYALELVHIIHEVASERTNLGNAWAKLDNFLREGSAEIKILILHSYDQLGIDMDEVSNKILFLKEIYQIKVVCLDEQFVIKIIHVINGIKWLDVIKKQISELLLKYLITFRSKQISFTVQGLANFSAMDSEFLLQPYETYQDLYEQSLLSKIFDPKSFYFDPEQSLSLVESTLMMLMSLYIVDMEYVIFKSIASIDKNDTTAAREFLVEFSDQFWNEFKKC